MIRIIGIIVMVYLIFGLIVTGVCIWSEERNLENDMITTVHNALYEDNRDFRLLDKRARIKFIVIIFFIYSCYSVATWPKLVPEAFYATIKRK